MAWRMPVATVEAPPENSGVSQAPCDTARVITKVNVAQCDMQLLYERGKFKASYHDLTEALGARVIGATVFETEAGYTRGPYHFHDGVEEWMYVVSGAPVLRDPSGERALEPGTVVAFQAGPDGAHTVDGPGRVVMFSVGARGWGEAFTSVYLDADKIGGKPGVQFLRTAALETWPEPVAVPAPPAPAGRCPQVACCQSQPTAHTSLSACTRRLGPPPCTSSARAKRPARTTTTGAASIGCSCSPACRRCGTLAAKTSWRPTTSSAFPRAKPAPISS